MTVSISQAYSDDVHECALLLSRALGEDDVLKAIIRGDNRLSRLIEFYSALLRSGPLQHGTVDIARVDGGAIAGVAIWKAPNPPESHPIQRFREAMAVGWRHLADVRALDHEFDAHRPEEPHWYLTDIAVAPGHQGLGIGSALLEDRLTKIDAARAPAYLEATTEASRRLYERYGFRFVDTINPAGPSAFAMLRQASALSPEPLVDEER